MSNTCRLPNRNDPMDESFSMRLYTVGEEGYINPTHTAIRKEVMEISRTRSGEIYFQCGCCKHLPHADRAKQSSIAPQNLSGLYRGFVRFMMYHIPACGHIPASIKDLKPPKDTKDVKARGITKHWVNSAQMKGLTDGGEGRGIIYSQTS